VSTTNELLAEFHSLRLRLAIARLRRDTVQRSRAKAGFSVFFSKKLLVTESRPFFNPLQKNLVKYPHV
jgi:hypothetical protein